MKEPIGQQLGNYRLVQHLGQGSFADVYLGEHRYLRSYAALKLLHTSVSGESARQFLFEAQTLVRLNHRHIVRVLDFSIERERPVLVMEYVGGGSLRQRHERGSCLSLDQVLYYVQQIAEALQYAHNHQIIHRDVKPENVLIGPEQQLCLSDFGLALFAPTLKERDEPGMAGTPLYIAPEQIEGRPTFASDQYALAIMTYEWLCGKCPFSGSLFELWRAHTYTPPPPLRTICPELPEEVEKVVLRALSKDPQQRFVSVKAFAQALERASQKMVTTSTLVQHGHVLSGESEPLLQRKLFVASAHADRAVVEKLSTDLNQQDISFSLDPLAALTQEEVLREAIRAAYLVCVVVSPHMRNSPIVQECLRVALLYRRRLAFLWASGENIAASLLDLSGRTRSIDVIDARNGRYTRALTELVDCLREDTGLMPILTPELTTLTDEPRNPYKGLRTFLRADANDFFGRTVLVQRLVNMVEEMRGGSRSGKRLLAVVGPSGSGKSSLVMAGLLPALYRGATSGSEAWCYLEPLFPGRHPCDALLSLFEKQFPHKSRTDLRAMLAEEHCAGLRQLTTFLGTATRRQVVLCIDQFEELFSADVPDAERRHFLRLLIDAVTDPHCPLIVVLTLRADFYDRPMRYRELAQLIEANQVSVLPMDNQELRAVIEQPAMQPDVQLFFEGDLVGDILFELQGQSNALPLLEFTLDQLFQRRKEHWLTLDAYHEIGGLRGALARHAEEVFLTLSTDQERLLARTLFLRLIDPGKSEHDTTRRRAALSELLLADDEQTALLSKVAHIFISARLLTTSSIAGVTSIEVSHEALIREWPRLAIWLHEAREDIILQHTIAIDAADWEKHHQASDRLYRGVQLAEALEWVRRHIANAVEIAFIQASKQEQQRQELETRSRLQRELKLERRTVRWLWAFVVVLFLFLAGSVFTEVNLQNSKRVIQNLSQQRLGEAEVAQENALAANSNYALVQNHVDLALLLSVEATKRWPWATTYAARNSLFQALNANKQLAMYFAPPISAAVGLTFTADGQALLVTDGYRVYRLDTKSGHSTPVPLLNVPQFRGGMAFAPDGRALLGAFSGGIWLWDVQTGKARLLAGSVHAGVDDIHATVSFSIDGRYAVAARCAQYTADASGALTICAQTQLLAWNMSTLQPLGLPLTVPGDVTDLVVSSPSAQTAIATQQGIQFWNAGTDQVLSPAMPASDHTANLAFSPDGTFLASGNSTGSVFLWNLALQQQAMHMQMAPMYAITCLSFSKDGKKLASGNADKNVEVWDTHTGTSLRSLIGDGSAKTSVAFASDSTYLATGSDDGQVLLWNLATENPLSQVLTTLQGWHGLLVSKDKQTVFVGAENGKVYQQNAASGKVLQTFAMDDLPLLSSPDIDSASRSIIQALSLSDDGKILATGRMDGMIALWNIADGKRLSTFMNPVPLYQLRLYAQGKMLISSGTQGKLFVWDIAQKAVPHVLQSTYLNPYAPFALSSDARWLAVADCARSASGGSCTQATVRIFAGDTLQPVHQFALKQADIFSLAFSPKKDFLALGTDDGIELWSTSSWTRMATMQIPSTVYANMDVSTGLYSNLQFSPDGQFLASCITNGGQGFSFVLWNMASREAFVDVITDETSLYGSLMFSPDSQGLFIVTNTAGNNELAYWTLLFPEWQQRACRIANRNLTQVEWNQFIQSGARGQTCKALPL